MIDQREKSGISPTINDLSLDAEAIKLSFGEKQVSFIYFEYFYI